MAFNAESVMEYIRANGPSVPNQIRQALAAQDNFVVGAVLSELSSTGRLALTNLSYGTSKFYYDPAKPELLEPLGKYLNEKDQRAFHLLKEQGVLRHSELSPLNRVAVASIKDFSRPLRVVNQAGEELFWRYYLLDEVKAFDVVVQKYFPSQKKQSNHSEVVNTASANTHSPNTGVATSNSSKSESENQETLSSQADSASIETGSTQSNSTTQAKETKRKTASKRKTSSQAKTSGKAAVKEEASEFSQRIAEYFGIRQIKLDEDLGSNKKEMAAIVRVPSAIGDMRYYCKAKVKKTTTDGDLAAAFLEAQKRSLPLLYIAGGTLSKRAQEQLPHLKGAIVVRPWAGEAY